MNKRVNLHYLSYKKMIIFGKLCFSNISKFKITGSKYYFGTSVKFCHQNKLRLMGSDNKLETSKLSIA